MSADATSGDRGTRAHELARLDRARRLSIVIPVYNGALTIGALVEALIEALGVRSLQIVLVNDGSADDSDAVCRALKARCPGTITYVNLSKNFGEHNAVM